MTLVLHRRQLPAKLGRTTAQESLAVTLNTPGSRFTVIAPSTALGDGKSLLSIACVAGLIRLEKILIVNVQFSNVIGVIVEFQVRRFTSHSGGTLLTPQMHDTIDTPTAVACTGAILVDESPSYLNRVWWSSDEWGTNVDDTATADHRVQKMSDAFGDYTIRPGAGISVRCNTNTSVGTFDIIAIGMQE